MDGWMDVRRDYASSSKDVLLGYVHHDEDSDRKARWSKEDIPPPVLSSVWQ
jgi:hypothetical protein